MSITQEMGLGGIAVLGILVTICTVIFRAARQRFTTLDTLRRNALEATKILRKKLRDHDNTIFKRQEMAADYRFAIAKLEAERDVLTRRLEVTQHSLNAEKTKQFKRKPEDVL